MPHNVSRSLALCLAAVSAAACAPDQPLPLAPEGPSFAAAGGGAGVQYTGEFIILGRGGQLPSNLEAQVRAAGGRIVSTIPEIGVAFAAPVAGDFRARAARISGVESVTPDVALQFTETTAGTFAEELTADASAQVSASATFDPTVESFWGWQWAPQAINAPEAWAAGYTGAGARVAILDGGLHSAHLDLDGNIDVARSASFVPGVAWNQDLGTFWHGTHVAGIVAAEANGIGTIGIAPKATLVGVKVLHGGSGAFSWILNGIIYAATPIANGGGGANVINMSLGATIDYRNNWKDKGFRDDFRELQKAYDAATRYATQQGVTVIASSGNGETNFDVAKELFKFPAENQHVLSISSTGPIGWGRGATNFDRPAYYTDFGKSLVSLAAPGGTVGLAIEFGDFTACTVAGVPRTCAVYDQVLSSQRGTSNGSYTWAQGTSMAAPAAAGVAALIVEKSGGAATPAQVRAALEQGAADLGKPGNDEYYGAGWVNAYRSVR